MQRYDRQRRFFGDEGQEALGALRVAVIGLSGTGSHIAQLLASLGVGYVVLIDPDVLEETNRNRIVGVRESDPLGMPKVEIAARLIRETNSVVEVTPLAMDFREEAALNALRDVSWVFGCVDNDGARLELLNLRVGYGFHYLDLATQIHPEARRVIYGGRVCVMTDGQACLFCLDQLSQEDIRESLETSAAARDREAIYGVSKDALAGSGPSVVTLNGRVAYVAGDEFLAAVVGLRAPVRLLEYRGNFGRMVYPDRVPAPDCFYCAQYRRAIQRTGGSESAA